MEVIEAFLFFSYCLHFNEIIFKMRSNIFRKLINFVVPSGGGGGGNFRKISEGKIWFLYIKYDRKTSNWSLTNNQNIIYKIEFLVPASEASPNVASAYVAPSNLNSGGPSVRNIISIIIIFRSFVYIIIFFL